MSVNIKFICTSFRNRQNSEPLASFSGLFRSEYKCRMNFIFNDNVRILCLSCNVKKVGKLVRFKQKGHKQASFLVFHKCCQGCLLRGPRYISTSFLSAPSAVHSYRVPGKFIRRLKSLFVGWKVYSSSTNQAKIYSHSIFVQQMYWLQDKKQYKCWKSCI